MTLEGHNWRMFVWMMINMDRFDPLVWASTVMLLILGVKCVKTLLVLAVKGIWSTFVIIILGLGVIDLITKIQIRNM
ncbi:unnamed protein product [Linum tenue]|uniref:Uncharacterized protein n=1 Tax=Linum tenue TaxID=586396 RepID=A0AAV0QXI5_9ROSI|nr:unnamed protein product [Linum tenue]CAI0548823.1 unnamed protein product [Linum tenue]